MLAYIASLFITFASLLPGADEANLVFVGDAMQHQGQLDVARRGGTYNYDSCFVSIAPIVQAADLAVVNLETPVGAAPYSGYPCFNAPPQFVDALSNAGFDLFLTANNHCLDRGAKGLRATVDALDQRKLQHTGTFKDQAARKACTPLVLDVKGFKIGFINCTYGTNGITARDGVVVDYIDTLRIKADIRNARAAGAEMLCVAPHWGVEYVLLPNKEQKRLADWLERQGVDMVIGGHPHVIQPMEMRPNRYMPMKNFCLVYSLGNFISNMKTPDTRGGAMFHVKLKRNPDGSACVSEASYRLLFTVPGVVGGANYRMRQADKVKGQWRAAAENFARRARAVFDKHNINVPMAQ